MQFSGVIINLFLVVMTIIRKNINFFNQNNFLIYFIIFFNQEKEIFTVEILYVLLFFIYTMFIQFHQKIQKICYPQLKYYWNLKKPNSGKIE